MTTIQQYQNHIVSVVFAYLQVCSWTLFFLCYDIDNLHRTTLDISMYLGIAMIFQVIKQFISIQVEDGNDVRRRYENIRIMTGLLMLAVSFLMSVIYMIMYSIAKEFMNLYVRDVMLMIITYSQNCGILIMYFSDKKQIESLKLFMISNILSAFQIVLALVNGPVYPKPYELIYCNLGIVVILFLGVCLCIGFIYGYISSVCSCQKTSCKSDKPYIPMV
jgi:hypothetical protein